jgi:hypothetical protein
VRYHRSPGAGAGSLDTLLRDLDARWLAEHVDREVLRTAMDALPRYEVPPHAEGEHVHAVLAPTRHRIRVPAELCVQNEDGDTEALCTLCQFGFRVCEHAASLLVDLAASAELREALRRREDTTPLLSGVREAREEMRRELALVRAAEAWDVAPIAAVDLEITLAVLDGRDADATSRGGPHVAVAGAAPAPARRAGPARPRRRAADLLPAGDAPPA